MLFESISKQATELNIIQLPQMYHVEQELFSIHLYLPINGILFNTIMVQDKDGKYNYNREKYTFDQLVMILNRNSIEIGSILTDNPKIELSINNV